MSEGISSFNACESAIDAHHHFWIHGESHQAWRGPEHGVLERDFQPADLRPGMRAANVERTVLVQSVNTVAENDRLLAYAAAVDVVAGVVAWLPLADPDTAGPMLDTLRRHPAVRGVRCLIGRDDLDWLDRPAVRALLADVAATGWAWDIVPVTATQVRALLAVIERVPDLRVVVDHLGRPPVDTGEWQPWARHMVDLAAAPNVAVKVSVGIDALTAWPEWNAGQLQRYVDHVAAVFGPDRMMLASNWPVITLRCDYARAWNDLDTAVQDAGITAAGDGSGGALAAVRGGTARHWYGLTHGTAEPVRRR